MVVLAARVRLLGRVVVRWVLGRILGGRFGFRRGFVAFMDLVLVLGGILMSGGGMFFPVFFLG